MTMKRTKLFRCERCNNLRFKNPNIKRQKVCLSCTKPQGMSRADGKHTHKTWSTSKRDSNEMYS